MRSRNLPREVGGRSGRTHLTAGHRTCSARFFFSWAFFRRARFDAPVSVGRNKSKLANSKRSGNSYYTVSRSAAQPPLSPLIYKAEVHFALAVDSSFLASILWLGFPSLLGLITPYPEIVILTIMDRKTDCAESPRERPRHIWERLLRM